MDVLVNEKIKATQVHLLGNDKQSLGIKAYRDAIQEARSLQLDLVQVGERKDGDRTIPVVQIMDAGKYIFDLKKNARTKARTAKENSSKLKEIKIRPVTDKADMERIIQHVVEFLNEGHEVRILCKFRGREMQFKNQGREKLDEIKTAALALGHRLKSDISDGGRTMLMALQGKKNEA